MAKVSGSELYDVNIAIATLPKARWKRLLSLCTGQIGSALELLQGRLSDRVMSTVTNRKKGLFPGPQEIEMDCSCPDWATMCKHVAAVLYGTGAWLDESPGLLFHLRGVDYQDLLSGASVRAVMSKASFRAGRILEEGKVGEVFGIDLAPKIPAKTQPREGKARTPLWTKTAPTRKGPSRGLKGRSTKPPARKRNKANPEMARQSTSKGA